MSSVSWSQFFSATLILVGVPTLIGAGIIIWPVMRAERAGLAGRGGTGGGSLGPWSTGLVAFPLGFLACMGWLTWSADYHGEFRGPGLPAPNEFPTWQVIACGATVVLVCFVAARLSRWAIAGGLAAAAGTAAGFATAFSVAASTDSTGQSGVGVALSMIGWAVGLGVLMLVRGFWMAGRRTLSSPS
ncbi:hypothetical protein [Tomitella biformata]|uniref:hypothetical protein n=1 Tax=Tomitella biformata TaxID=630403 RepID=UPI000466E09F|nr:hypothetical protein [Tomitella biformata]